LRTAWLLCPQLRTAFPSSDLGVAGGRERERERGERERERGGRGEVSVVERMHWNGGRGDDVTKSGRGMDRVIRDKKKRRDREREDRTMKRDQSTWKTS
jgi:hypothetical protein